MKILVDSDRLSTVIDNLYHINDLSLLLHRPCEKKLIEDTINIVFDIIKVSPEHLDEDSINQQVKDIAKGLRLNNENIS